MAPVVKHRPRHKLAHAGAELLRRAGRIRWLTKYKALRYAGIKLHEQPRYLRYVLLDPEFDNFTFELANEKELLGFLHEQLRVDLADLEAYLEETRTDPGLTRDLWRRLRWRLDYKRRPPLGGKRIAAYITARAVKPRLAIETGVQDGLGSLTLLRALAHNRKDGHPGRLVSIDILPTAGWIVPRREREHWQLMIGSSDALLAEVLAKTDERVGLLVQDTVDLALGERELETLIEHTEPGAAILTGQQRPALQELAALHGLPYAEFKHQPHKHFYGQSVTAITTVTHHET